MQYEEVLKSRKSDRHFRKPAASKVGDILWLTQGITHGRSEIHRALPSPGGLHSVRLLILNYPGHPDKALLYVPEFHSLALIATGPSIRRCQKAFSKALPLASGVVIWFIGDYARISGKYKNPESLLWKEAGVLTAGVYLAAAHLQLKCCAIGKNGATELSQINAPLSRFVALGACILGQ